MAASVGGRRPLSFAECWSSNRFARHRFLPFFGPRSGGAAPGYRSSLLPISTTLSLCPVSAGRFSPLGPRGMGLALGPSNERLELLMKRGDWRQAADRFRLLPDCVPYRFGEGVPLKNDGGPEILKGDIVALL